MSAQAVESAVCVCGSDHLCACGCGESVHPFVRRVHELEASGAKPMQMARLLGIDKAQVWTYRTKPPRFLKGHWVAAQAKPLVPCTNCGRLYRKMGPNHLYCTYGSRRLFGDERDECARLARQAQAQRWLDHDAGIERREREREAARVAVAERKALLYRLLRQETPPEWLVAQTATDDENLAALIAEQEKDARWGDHVWTFGLRLDKEYEYGGGDPGRDGVYDLHEYVGDNYSPGVSTDPLAICIESERSSALRALTAGMEIEDIAHMDGESLDWLQERLRAEGMTPGGVQDAERERLRDPATHSGIQYAKAPLIPGKKKRRQKIEHKAANRARGNSNRPAQKPRKRWDRYEIAEDAE